tara:strand:- start:1211 stop:1420 length:210 start_codon:yes stop_codon:yes gene_type:complete
MPIPVSPDKHGAIPPKPAKKNGTIRENARVLPGHPGTQIENKARKRKTIPLLIITVIIETEHTFDMYGD